jgi:hypothetical protein
VSATGRTGVEPDIKKTLIELSHIWMEAAVKEERHILDEHGPRSKFKKQKPHS